MRFIQFCAGKRSGDGKRQGWAGERGGVLCGMEVVVWSCWHLRQSFNLHSWTLPYVELGLPRLQGTRLVNGRSSPWGHHLM